MHGTTREPRWRETANEMGDVPVLDDGKPRLTQSGVILTHLARKHGTFGGTGEERQQEVLRRRLDNAFGIVNNNLEKHAFMAGSASAIADLSVCGYLHDPAEESGYEVATRFARISA